MSRAPQVGAIMALVDRMSPSDGGNAASRQFHSEAVRLRDAVQALDNARQRRSQLETPGAHAVKVAKAARKVSADATASLNRMLALSGNAQADIQRRIKDKANLVPNEFAKEIRERFRGMSGKEQAKQIEQWTEQGKGPEIAAILHAPSMLTGLHEEQKDRYEQAFIAKHAGDLLSEQSEVADTLEAYLAADRAVADMVKSLTDPRMLADIERSAAESNDAWAAFDSLSGNVSTGA